MATFRFLLKRFVAQRMLGLAVVVTLAFSIGVLVAGPIYAGAAREAIVSAVTSTGDVNVVNTRFTVYGDPSFDYGAADAAVNSATDALPLKTLVSQGRGPVVVGLDRPTYTTTAVFRIGAEDHLPAFEGTAPGPGEVALPSALARSLGVRVGDRIVVGRGSEALTSLTLTATFDLPPPSDPFWFGSKDPFPAPSESRTTLDATQPSPILLSRDGYLRLARQLDITTEFAWDAYVDFRSLRFDQIDRLPAQIAAATDELKAQPSLQQLQAANGLDTLLAIVRQRIDDLRVPILLVVFQIGAVTLAVLAGVGSLTLTRQAFELAVLHSRGLSRRTLMIAQAAQAVFSALVAYPLGLLLGIGLAKLASGSNGPTLPGTLFPIRLTTSAELLGLAAAIVGALILLLLSIPHVRRTVLEQRHSISREDRPPLVRLPVELFLLPVGVFAFIQLRGESAPKPGTGTIDPLVLLAPTLLIFAVSFLALRLLMVGLRAADRAIGRSRSLPRYLAFRRLGRAPGIGFAAALLLVLSMGLLVVSTSYRAIALRSHQDGAHQVVGGDWNIQVATPEQPLVAIRHMPAATTPIVRTQPFFGSGRFTQVPNALAIDPATFQAGGWWRSDYSDTGLGDILDALTTDPIGIALPAGNATLTVNLTSPKQAAGLTLAATVEAADGTVTTGRADHALAAGAARYTINLAGGSRLLSISLSNEAGADLPVSLTFDGVGVSAGDRALSLQSFAPMTWRSSSGRLQGTSFTMQPGLGTVVGGFVPVPPDLPVVASPDVAQQLGDRFPVSLGAQQFEAKVIAVADTLPSTSPGSPFIIVSAPTLLERAAAIPEPGLALNEVWANGEADPRPGLEKAGFIVGDVQRTAPIVGALAQLPQSLAVGLEFTSAAAGLGLVIIGVAVGLSISQRRRDFEFAAMRAMGTEPSELRRTVILEQLVLLGFSVIAGLGIGYLMLKVMLPYFGRDIGVAFPKPVLVVDVVTLGASILAIAVATGLGLALALRSLLRSSVTGVLRGEAE